MAAFSKPSGMVSMLFTVLVLLQAVAASHGHAHVIHRSPEALLKRADNVQTKGASDGTAYPRLEIRDLQKNADQFNLYILALENLQAKDKKDAQSYYQIAGIHGRPYVPWNEPGPLKNIGGYCPHRQALFGTWHRPYLALFEQALYANAKEVIAKFPSGDQAKWNDALKGLRMPYFDWAQEPTVSGEYVPKFIRDEKISVTKASGKVTIDNPLYAYSFGSSLPSEMGWGPKNGFPKTLRHPVGTVSNNDEVNAVFGSARVGWRQRVFALFASKQPWGKVSSAQFGVSTSRQNTDSYESVHDEIHSTIGGNEGWMGYLDVAAFDPLFWLHHTNIDRLLTMHQILTPDSWVQAGVLDTNTAQWSAGEMKDENTPLKPFMKDASGSYYTSRDVKETRALGYYYPETENKDYNQVVAAINKLYGAGEKGMDSVSSSSSASATKASSTGKSSSSASSAKATSSSGASSSKGASSSAATSSKGASSSAGSTSKGASSAAPTSKGASSTGKGSSASASKTSSGSTSKPTSGSGNGNTGTKQPFPGRPFKNGDYDTVLSVIGDKYGMPGSYKVYCFLGNKPITSNNSTSNSTIPGSKGNSTIPGNKNNSTVSLPPVQLPSKNSTSTNYYDHPDYVGSHAFLGGSVVKTNVSNPVLTEGSIPLTSCLQGKIESGELESLHPDHVEPYLNDNLHYKIVGPNGQEFEPAKVPNFHAKVKSCPVAPAPEGQLPTFHEYIDLPRVNLPASAPWSPPPPAVPSSPSGSPSGTGSMPWDEPGYCVSSQTIHYVDAAGKFLYSEVL